MRIIWTAWVRRNWLLFPAEEKSIDIAVVRFLQGLVLGKLGQKNEPFECPHYLKWHGAEC